MTTLVPTCPRLLTLHAMKAHDFTEAAVFVCLRWTSLNDGQLRHDRRAFIGMDSNEVLDARRA